MSLPIYDTIGRFFGWRQMPKDDAGAPFFGFIGCTRSTLESVLEGLRADNSWIGQTAAARSSFFNRIAWDYSAATGADYNGLVKWCNWVYVAEQGDTAVKDWLGGGRFETIDYFAKVIKEAVTDTAQAAAETIEYGVKYQGEAEKTLLNRVLPVVGIVAACYLVKKILD